MKIEIIISIICTLAASFKWIYEYAGKIEWERNRFLLEQIEKFRNLESTKIMETILDWNSASVNINGEKIFITDDLLFGAFQTHNFKSNFTKDEFKLRGIFDEYFDNLTNLVFMSKVGLVNRKNLLVFMGYWTSILSGKSQNKPYELVKQIHNYLQFYGYHPLKEFIADEP